MDKANSLPEIGIVDYSGVQTAAVLGMTDFFVAAEGMARRHLAKDQAVLRVSHWKHRDAGDGVERSFDTLPDLEMGRPSVIIIPPGLGDPMPQAEASIYADWLRNERSRGVALCSICKGAFLLGETGLLAERTITTHWTYEEQFVSRFPGVRVDTDRLIIDDGDILTAGGVMSWIDVSLKLIGRFLGPAIMLDTARVFLVDPPGREQSYYSAFSPRLNHGDQTILKLQHWLQAGGGKEMGLAALAQQAGLEQRTLMRRFQKATGHSAGEYVQRLRVNTARELLQLTQDPIETIAWKVHYRDPGAFRKVFTRIVGLTPAEYRKRFRPELGQKDI